MKDKPNEVTATLKVVVTGEFYDDDATEETLRYAVEQDLEDSGFDADVSLMKENIVLCKDCKHFDKSFSYDANKGFCSISEIRHDCHWFCADGERRRSE